MQSNQPTTIAQNARDFVATIRQCESNGCLLSEHIGDVLCTLDDDLTITFASHSATRLFGYTPDELYHLPLDRLFVPTSYRTLAIAFKKILKHSHTVHRPRVLELEGVTKSGSPVWVEMRITLIADSDASCSVLLAVMHDISQRRATEIEKNRLEKRLLKTQRLETVGTLAGGIAHDFNNILTTINGYCELILKNIEPSHSFYEDVQQIRNAASRGEALVRQLLAFARRQQSQLFVLNANQVIQEMLKMLDRLIGEDIVISTELAPDLWDVRADAGRLEQVVMNLVVNARDAMPEGGKITIYTDNIVLSSEAAATMPEGRSGQFVRISIADTGKGIDEKNRDKMFEPFFTTKREGAGLGLATVKAIAVQHKGWVTATNAPEGGAVFSLYLPAVAEPAHREGNQHTVRATPQSSNNNERIIVVEDDAAIRDVICRTLSSEGYLVTAAADAEQALALIEQHPAEYDLLFSDVVLPGKSGLELALVLQAKKPTLRILLASGYTDDKAQWAEIKKRGFRFLRKPFLIEELLKTIRQTLES